MSRRERQIMDVIYAKQQASAQEVKEGLADAPSYSAVRALLRILEEKGHLTHRAVDGKYIYAPTRRREQAAKGALRGMLHTFFENSAVKAVAALLDATETSLSDADFQTLAEMIEQARKRGNRP